MSEIIWISNFVTLKIAIEDQCEKVLWTWPERSILSIEEDAIDNSRLRL